jgi:hypothetical protein
MKYRAQVILDIDFPEAESLEAAKTTLDIWLDLVAPVLETRVHWESVEGLPVYEVGDQD